MRERLQKLENNITGLKEFSKSYTVSEVKNDKKKEWALRYGLLESIQIVIDISCHLGDFTTFATIINGRFS